MNEQPDLTPDEERLATAAGALLRTIVGAAPKPWDTSSRCWPATTTTTWPSWSSSKQALPASRRPLLRPRDVIGCALTLPGRSLSTSLDTLRSHLTELR